MLARFANVLFQKNPISEVTTKTHTKKAYLLAAKYAKKVFIVKLI
jgi:hypothetical protein